MVIFSTKNFFWWFVSDHQVPCRLHNRVAVSGNYLIWHYLFSSHSLCLWRTSSFLSFVVWNHFLLPFHKFNWRDNVFLSSSKCTGIFKDLNRMLVSIVSSQKLQEATVVFRWTLHWITRGHWCNPEFPHSLPLNRVIPPFCRMIILSIHFSTVNLPQESLWNRKVSLLDLSLMSGLKPGILGLVLKMKDPIRLPFPQPSFQYLFQWLHLISLLQVLNLHMVSSEIRWYPSKLSIFIWINWNFVADNWEHSA